MSKFEKITIVIVVTMLAYTASIKAQIPYNDSGWIINTAHSDEFDSTMINTTKWHNQFPWGIHSGGAEINLPANLIATGTTLKIKADTLAPGYDEYDQNPDFGTGDFITYVYQGGTLFSKEIIVGSDTIDAYHYGYLEISAKYPSGCYSLWPAFWLWMSDCDNPPYYYNEIDIAENYPDVTYAGNMTGTNIWMYCPRTDNGMDINNDFSVSGGFHTYAVEWLPDRVSWYIDDVLVRTYYDASGYSIPQYPMAAILTHGVGKEHAFLPANWNGFSHGNVTPVCFDGFGHPKYFEIDYLRYYQLETDCNTALVGLCNPGDYDRKVKQYITTHASCTPTFNPITFAGSYTLRATDHVTLNSGVTISPTGTGYFAIDIMECPQ